MKLSKFLNNFRNIKDESQQKELIKELLLTKVGKAVIVELELEKVLSYFDENVKILIRKSSLAQSYLLAMSDSTFGLKVFSKLWTHWFDRTSKQHIDTAFTHIENRLALIPKKLLPDEDDVDDEVMAKCEPFNFEKHIKNNNIDGNNIYVRTKNNKWMQWWLVYDEWFDSYDPYKTK